MTPDILARAVGCTEALAERYAAHLEEACRVFGIHTPTRQAAFLAQIGHESGSLRHVEELASGVAYEGRANLGNTRPGDGVKYKGHGLIQITGRDNHRAATLGLRGMGIQCPDFEETPAALTDPRWAAISAGWYWSSRRLNGLADVGDFEGITRKINGGLNGQPDRVRRWEKAKLVLATQAAAAPAEAKTEQPPAWSTSVPAFLIPALTAIVSALPELAKKWSGEEPSAIATRNIGLATMVVDTVKSAVGAANEQDLVEKLSADPSAVPRASAAVKEIWWKIDASGVSAARKANEAYLAPGAPGFWRNPAFWISIILLAGPAALLGDVFGWHPDAYDENMRTQIVTALLAVIMVVSGYWIGSSASSARKTELAAHTG